MYKLVLIEKNNSLIAKCSLWFVIQNTIQGLFAM